MRNPTRAMIDSDLQALKNLIARYGFETILLELLRMARAFAAVRPLQWRVARNNLSAAFFSLTGKRD